MFRDGVIAAPNAGTGKETRPLDHDRARQDVCPGPLHNARTLNGCFAHCEAYGKMKEKK
jgi:hypothetical protein